MTKVETVAEKKNLKAWIETAKSTLAQAECDYSPDQLKNELAKQYGLDNDTWLLIRESLEKLPNFDVATRLYLGALSKDVIAVVRGARHVDQYTFMVEAGENAQSAQQAEELEVKLANSLSMPKGLIPGDKILVRRQRKKWRIVSRVSRAQKQLMVKLVTELPARQKTIEGNILVAPINPFFPQVFVMHLNEPLERRLLTGKVFEVALDEQAPQDVWTEPTCTYVRTIGERNDPLGEMAIAQAEFGIPVNFSDQTLQEVARLPLKVDARSRKGRVDLRDIPFVTIDGEDARDFDDAVYAQVLDDGGWRLLVAIADVSHYVKPGSALDCDAQTRGTSVYFPASVVPMLPEELSNGLCSLNPDVDRLTLVCDAVLDAAGTVKAYQFYPAVIHSHARLTYTTVASALEGNTAAQEALGERLPEIRTLYALSQARGLQRKDRFALDFSTTESKAIFDEQGFISGFEMRRINDANRLIEECMLIANVCAAEFVLMHHEHTLFRVHDKPVASRLTALNAVLRNFSLPKVTTDPKTFAKVIERCSGQEFLQTQILRCMARACYTPENIGHYGLQFEAYAHFTSPIRRYPDLLLHRTIKGILSAKHYCPKIVTEQAPLIEEAYKLRLKPEERLHNKNAKRNKALSKSEQSELAVWTQLGYICSGTERRADDATRSVMNYLKCQYFLDQITIGGNLSYPAVVVGVIPAGLFVQLSDGIEGFVHVSCLGWDYYEYDEQAMSLVGETEGVKYKIGARVIVSGPLVDMDERRISFSECSLEEFGELGQTRRTRGRRYRYW